MLFRGIKTRVLIQFWILFFLSMLIIDLLVLFIFLERAITRYTEQKQFALRIIADSHFQPSTSDSSFLFSEEQSALLQEDCLLIVNPLGQANVNKHSRCPSKLLEKAVSQTRISGQPVTQKVGKTIGFLFPQHESLIITHSVKKEGDLIGTAGLQTELTHIYMDFRKIQKISFVFVLINSFFFSLFGNHQLTRSYFRPLKRLAKLAETYQDEDTLFFSVRKEDNEFSVLSSSLNKMLHRISEDKRVLKENIGSLKNANLELKKAQNDVIRAEKLTTVGRLASGIAHEIGNPVGIVLGYLDLLKQTDLTQDERNDFITRSQSEINRVNHIIRQLLNMSRFSGGEPKNVSIHQMLDDLVSVFKYQPTASTIVMTTKFRAVEDMVFADPDRLRQVFLNFMLNAVDALSSPKRENGRIMISTNSRINPETTPADSKTGTINVTIQDTGPGIASSHLPNVFDPFFTTKETGKGTGLGLSVSFMIVEKLGGQLTVESVEGEGACFTVVLPLSDHHGPNETNTEMGLYGNH